jgi:hypothetical protein
MNIITHTQYKPPSQVPRLGSQPQVKLSKEEMRSLVAIADRYEAKLKEQESPWLKIPGVKPMVSGLLNAKNALKKWVVGPSAGTVNGTTQHDLQK